MVVLPVISNDFLPPLLHWEIGIYARCLDWGDWFDVASHSKSAPKTTQAGIRSACGLRRVGGGLASAVDQRLWKEMGVSRVIMRDTRAFAHMPSALGIKELLQSPNGMSSLTLLYLVLCACGSMEMPG